MLWLLLVGLLISIGEVLLRSLHLDSLRVKPELIAVQGGSDRRKVTDEGSLRTIDHGLSLVKLLREGVEVGG